MFGLDRARAILFALVTTAMVAGSAPARAQAPGPAFVPPPRSIADITAILDQQKPEPDRRAKIEASADANPPAAGGRAALAKFHFQRAQARAALGRVEEAIADCETAIENGSDYVKEISRYEQYMEQLIRTSGNYKRAIELNERMRKKLDAPGSKGFLFNIYRRLVINYVNVGDLRAADAQLRKSQALMNEARRWPNYEHFGLGWEGNLEDTKARILEARGRYSEAEAAYHKAGILIREALEKWSNRPTAQPRAVWELGLDFMLANEGRTKARQGRLAEAEVDIRRALLNRLTAAGKYNQDTAQIILYLAHLMSEQARFAEAEHLSRAAVEIYQTISFRDDAQPYVIALNMLATTLFAQRRYADARLIYTAIDVATKSWEPARSERVRLGWSRILTNYYTRHVDEGLELAKEFVAKEKARAGDNHFDTAMARAILGAGLVFARRDGEAMQAFKLAIPVLTAATREGEEDDAGSAAADLRLQHVTESYMVLLSRSPDATDAAAETLRLGDLIRRHSVQNALAASAARATAKTPALAELARREQDLDKQIAADTGTFNNMLSLAPEERDANAVRDVQAELEKLRNERQSAKREIERKFPAYANLVAPKPVTAEDIRAALKPDEAFLAFYFGRRSSFVWAVPKTGPIAFAALAVTARDMEKKIKRLRTALEPNATIVGDIPPFDLRLAHELYASLLKPVEPAWRPAKSLILVTNGALGLLPLSLLPTEEPAEIEIDAEPYFSGYRNVAWLARTHAVTMVPSASALITLRHLPAGSVKRQSFIGFGDPIFSQEQAKDIRNEENLQVAELASRGIPIRLRAAPKALGVDTAQISELPRLPDTADELKAIAMALEVDPAKVLHLGKDANVKTVKSLDLWNYRIVAFATHGLVPGELDGLTQPALALSAPNVADIDGDGLLTMQEIFGLKLDADWVLLSACNTGAGSGAGAEAVSGLGRAFFYAGTRALLVTNWSVHSTSASKLITDLFLRQSTAKLTRAEALREAMLDLLDGPGATDDSGRTLFTYAHPLFWAPYTIIGDPGGD
jgi:CHAT domain-containing protein